MDVSNEVQRVLSIEIDGLNKMKDSLCLNDFSSLVSDCFQTLNKGEIIFIAVGKNTFIVKKIVATLKSFHIKARFLHPTEAIHGDMGVIKAKDILIFMSCSGESEEILKFINFLGDLKKKSWGIIGKEGSSLQEKVGKSLILNFGKEACPFSLAPTTSSLVFLALGDALAISLMKLSKFSFDDYGLSHPAGSIGKSLSLSLSDVMRTGDRLALVQGSSTVQEAILLMTKAQGGTVVVVDKKNRLQGLFTTGDLKRGLTTNPKLLSLKLSDVANKNPIFIRELVSLNELVTIFKRNKINSIPVVSKTKEVLGIVDIQDLGKIKF